MKIVKNRLIFGVISIVILLTSLVITLIDALVPLRLWTHPILNFFFFMFSMYGIVAFVYGIIKESPWWFFICSILLGLSVFYVLMQYVKWWLALIVVIVVIAVVAILSFVFLGNKTEEIALNESADYKTYKERKEQTKEE